MEQLAYRANTTVCKVVDVVASAETVTQAEVVVFDCHNVVKRDVFVNKLIHGGTDCKEQFFLVCAKLVHKGFEVGVINLFGDAEFSGVAIHKSFEVYGVVADDFEFLFFSVVIGVGKPNHVDGVVLDFSTLVSSTISPF